MTNERTDGSTGRTTRRAFLRRLARGSLGLAAAPVAAREVLASTSGDGGSIPSLARGPADESYWEQVRAAFSLRDGIAPMNAANLCPAPRSVTAAVWTAMKDVEGDVSFQNRSKYGDLHEIVRERLAGFLGADTGEIAIVRNTTEGNNIVIGGLPLDGGDEVVLWDQNHQTNDVAWDVRAERHGFDVKRVSVPEQPSGPRELFDAFEQALTSRTRVLAFSDISNVSGIRLPVADLCRLGRERGIHVHVDGAQSFGALRFDLHELGCDSYASSAHKWFMGPKEAGVLYVRAERVSEIWPGVVGVGWNSDAEPPVGARKFDTLGQRNDATIAGVAACLDFHELVGSERIEERVFELATRLKEQLVDLPGAEPVTPLSPDVSAGVVIFRFEGASESELYSALYREHGVAGATTGGMRLCPHIYNTHDDVDRAAAGLAEAIA